MKDIAKDIAGQRFGSLTVLARDFSPRYTKRAYWLCKCDCGEEHIVQGKHLRSGKIKSCGCGRKTPSNAWTGYKSISGSYWSNLQYKATQRGIDFSLQIEDAWRIYEQQDGKCALSGKPIHFVRNYREDRLKQTASLDRINNDGQYEKSNVQWVHKVVNTMRNTLNIDDFIGWCKAIEHNNGKEDH